MKTILIVGTILVNIALICYSFFIYNQRKVKVVNNKVLSFITLGVLFDIAATICMILGSSKGAFTIHGILGYSSLTGMLIDSVLLWKLRISDINNSTIPLKIHNYSLIAYLWWILAYITGALIVMGR